MGEEEKNEKKEPTGITDLKMTEKENRDGEEGEQSNAILPKDVNRNSEVNRENDYLMASKTQRNTFSKLSFCRKILFIIQNITVEPVVFMMGILVSMPTVVLTSFVEDKICLISLSYPDEVCRNLSDNKTLEDTVQTMTANFNMNKIIIETIPAVIITLLIGSYSDRYGRKKPMMIPAVGGSLSMMVTIALTYWMKQIPVEVLYLGSVFQSLAGGWTCILVGAGSYLSDVSPPENRTVRLAIMQAFFILATPIATTVGGIIYDHFGYMSVFATCFVVYVLVILYIIIVIKETVIVTPEDKQKNFFRGFFDFQNLKDCYQTLKKEREGNHRIGMFFLFAITFIDMLVNLGEAYIYYLFLKWKFNWSVLMYSRFFTTNLGASAVGLIILPLLRLFGCRLSNAILGILSILARIGKGILFALSNKGWMFFAGCGFVVFTDIINPVCRSIVSQYVSAEEQGKVFSIMGACEAITPAIASVFYTQVYNLTRSTYAGSVFFMSSCFSVITLLLYSFVILNNRRSEETLSETVYSEVDDLSS